MDAALNNEEHWLADPVQGQDHSVGPAAAPITIVEYGDYECPDCLNAVPIIEEVRQNLGDRLRFVFRHFPQNSIHPHASVAAEAAEAAADQGKFWENELCPHFVRFFQSRLGGAKDGLGIDRTIKTAAVDE